jgi:hypothetical protein
VSWTWQSVSSTAPSCRRKRGAGGGPTKRGKDCKIMSVADRDGLPLAIHIGAASPAEVGLVEPVLERHFVDDFPERLIGDKAYDSDPLGQRLAEQGVQMIAPHRRNGVRPKTQDDDRCGVTVAAGRWSV